MALHPNEVSMLRESLQEYVQLAGLGANFRKPDGGILGYPTATLLFSVIDSIGSFHMGHSTFTVDVEGAARKITNTGDHFLILNSSYFGLGLTDAQVWDVYALSRCPLTHNALLGDGHYLIGGDVQGEPFRFEDGVVIVNVRALLARCDLAVQRFLADAPAIVPDSATVRQLRDEAVERARSRE